jgi:hypothetical protein
MSKKTRVYVEIHKTETRDGWVLKTEVYSYDLEDRECTNRHEILTTLLLCSDEPLIQGVDFT